MLSQGGGFYIEHFPGQAALLNTSFCGNQASVGQDGYVEDGASVCADGATKVTGIVGIVTTCKAPPPPPPPTPPGPGPIPSVWPSFASAAALQGDPWGVYFNSLYGGLPTVYPFKTSSLWVLHDSVLIHSHVTAVPSSTSCPTKALDRYTTNDAYQPPLLTWIWHSYPFAALSENSFVEVIHEADPFGDETTGMWMLYTPGSGIYFNIGKTIAFAEHNDAYSHFAISGVPDYNSAMSAAAAAQGYDSVQFLAHTDHVSYQCDTKNTGVPGFDYMGLEIVAVGLVGTYACGTANGAPASIKRGWAASTSCNCDNSKQFLNCQGTPAVRTNMTAQMQAAR